VERGGKERGKGKVREKEGEGGEREKGRRWADLGKG